MDIDKKRILIKEYCKNKGWLVGATDTHDVVDITTYYDPTERSYILFIMLRSLSVHLVFFFFL